MSLKDEDEDEEIAVRADKIEKKEPGTDHTDLLPAVSSPKEWDLDTPINPRLAYAYCEEIAFGQTLKQIEQMPGMPPAKVFLSWLMKEPALLRAYMVAREMSGFMMEDEALQLARELVEDPQNNQHIRAVEVLINQLKWTAGKRNPQVFSDKAQVNVTVPIQINTTLDMGDTGTQGTPQFPNIYEMRATIGVEVDTPNGQVVPRKAKRGETKVERQARELAEEIEARKRAERQRRRLEHLRKMQAERLAKKRAKAQQEAKDGGAGST